MNYPQREYIYDQRARYGVQTIEPPCLALRTLYEIFGHLTEFAGAPQAVPPPERVFFLQNLE